MNKETTFVKRIPIALEVDEAPKALVEPENKLSIAPGYPVVGESTGTYDAGEAKDTARDNGTASGGSTE